MKSVAIRLIVVAKFELRDAQRHHRRRLCPTLVKLDEAIENALIIHCVILCSDDERPRLGIVRRSSPSGGFEEGAKLLRLYRTILKRTWAPAVTDQIMYRFARIRWPF